MIVSERRQTSIMYRVQGTMRENYYGADTEADMPRKSNLVCSGINILIYIVVFSSSETLLFPYDSMIGNTSTGLLKHYV